MSFRNLEYFPQTYEHKAGLAHYYLHCLEFFIIYLHYTVSLNLCIPVSYQR